jgi:uncharacterized protein GlcG (DUF336 family)
MEPRAPTGPITSDIALNAISAARDEAKRISAAVSVAVVDAGGNLKAFLRMDGAEIAGTSLAIDKAYTAVAGRLATHELAELARPGGELFGLHTTCGGRFVIFGGGLPVITEGEVVGAIGVSGGSVADDVMCATAGVQAVLKVLGPGNSQPIPSPGA